MAMVIFMCVAQGGVPVAFAAADGGRLEPMVVTATRTAVAPGEVGGNAVTVITADEIAARRMTTVEEVLKSVPGLHVVANGGPGTSTSVFLRGADAKNTLVLVDGVMFNDPSNPTRSADLANLTVDNIERIEVVRGALSTLYGSNATAGVVNIITRRGRGKPTVDTGAEGGAYDTWRVYGNSSGSLRDRLRYAVGVSRTETDGFSTADDDNHRIPRAGNTDEDDGWENTTLSGSVEFDLLPTVMLSAMMRYIDSEVDEDDYNWNGYVGDRFDTVGWDQVAAPDGATKRRTEHEQVFARAACEAHLLDDLLVSRLAYQLGSQDRQSYDNDGFDLYDYDGMTHEITWQGDFYYRDRHVLSLGAGYFYEEMKSRSSGFPENDANITSAWVQDQWTPVSGLVVVAGARLDDHDRFGSETTWRLAPAYTMARTGTTFKASYGTGYRAPSLYELYSDYGNENLDAETSEGWDVGIEQGLLDRRLTCGLTYFEMDFDDRIDYDFLTWKYSQMPGTTETRGIEFFVDYTPVSFLDLAFNYTYTDTEDPDGGRLTRRPLNRVFASARWRCLNDRGQVNLDMLWVDDRAASESAGDLNGDRVGTLDAYTVVNLAAHYDVNEHLRLYGRIDNLFDEYYEEAWSYATPGLSAYAGAKLHW
jgi:vitamin B12 transporter